jgi:hypothetical protein
VLSQQFLRCSTFSISSSCIVVNGYRRESLGRMNQTGEVLEHRLDLIPVIDDMVVEFLLLGYAAELHALGVDA